jgi:periplasmic protein TonB
MVRYNISFRASRQASDDGGLTVPLGVAGVPWGPLSRRRPHWRPALAGTALVHLLGIVPALLLISDAAPVSPSPETAVEMVFSEPAPPSPLQAEPEQAAPVTSTAEPPAPELPPPEEPVPEAATPKPPDPRLPEPQEATASAEEAEPLPVPPPPPPPRSVTRAAVSRKIFAPQRETSTAPATSSGPSPAAPPAAESPSPAQPAVTVSPGWRQALAAWLAQHKVYPEEARRQGIEGTVTLRFSIGRAGHVIDVSVVRGSGSPILDSSAEAVLRNATLPPPPPTMPDRVTVSVQIHYSLAQ